MELIIFSLLVLGLIGSWFAVLKWCKARSVLVHDGQAECPLRRSGKHSHRS